MTNHLDFDHLRTLVAVAETGSFSVAAQRIGRSQSAVSMQIQKLEHMLGKDLLVRGGRTVVPTHAGNDLLVYAQKILKLSDEAWANLTQPSITGTVRLGVPEDYAAALLPGVLERYGREFPRVTVELVCEPSYLLAESLTDNTIDIAVVTRAEGQSMDVLRREPMVWVASAAHAAWEQDPLPVALFQTCTARSYILNALTDAEKKYYCTYSSASLAGLLTIVQAGLAVAGLALCSVPPGMRVIGEQQGLPSLQELEIGVLRSVASTSGAVLGMHDVIRRELPQAGRHAGG